MNLEFLVEVNILDTWGYENRRMENRIRYFLPTLHHGDYETILAHVNIPAQRYDGIVEIARFTVRYDDMFGNPHLSGPHILRANFVNVKQPVTGFTDGKILESGTMLHFAKTLKVVGDCYYHDRSEENLDRALEIALNTKKELLNARTRLDSQGFVDEIGILDNYIDVIGSELYVSEQRLEDLYRKGEIAPPVPDRPLEKNLKNLCREITLDLRTRRAGTVAVCDFSSKGSDTGELNALITDMIFLEISRIDELKLIEREELRSAFRDRGLSPENLSDTLNAVELGRLLAADYIMTGMVIETENTYIIFSRLLNVSSGELESSAQIIVSKV
jgi:TolB-like protein